MPRDRALEWLLEPEQPSIRYLALTQLLGRSTSEPEVVEARRDIPVRGWAAEILRDRRPDGRWGGGDRLYVPKYDGTNWKLLVLADLGVTRETPEVRASCKLWMDRLQKSDGGFGVDGGSSAHVCVTGNAARALLRLGYGDDPRVRRALDWLVADADPKGGWSCYGSGRLLDTWEPLSAFAEFPRDRWTPEMADVVAKGAEYFLERELYQQGERYEPWFRTHYPVHYYYDLLVGLDTLTALGYGNDPRLGVALRWLTGRRQTDGRWKLDAVHPDVEGGIAEWFEKHPKKRPTPFALEDVRKPSKMVTLVARRVLARVAAAKSTPARPAASPPETPRGASRGSTAGARRPSRRRAPTR
jgi:hypothetical protein